VKNVLIIEQSKVPKVNIYFDNKHINLFTYFITNKGKIVPKNISRMVERSHNCLVRASNEWTIVELVKAACKGIQEPIQGISEYNNRHKIKNRNMYFLYSSSYFRFFYYSVLTLGIL